MEQFSRAYVTAVATGAGCGVTRIEPDIDSLDLELRRRDIGTPVRSPQVDVQLKATYTDNLHPTSLSYALDKRTYDNLRDPNRGVPCILVVVRIPPRLEDWTHHDEDRLLIRRCGYWVSLRGMPNLPDGQQTRTISIPRTQVFDVVGCDALFARLANGQLP